MRNKVLLVIFLFMFWHVFLYSNESQSIKELLEEGEYSFFVNRQPNDSYFGELYFKNGEITTGYAASHVAYRVKEKNYISNTELVVTLLFSVSINADEAIREYRGWHYPRMYKVTITKEDVLTAIKNDFRTTIYIDYDIAYSTTCEAVIVTDNLRIRAEPNINAETTVLAKYSKFEKVTLYGKTSEESTIDGITAPWYKVKLSDGQEGWIFGGYAVIYFDERDLNYIYNAYSKEISPFAKIFEYSIENNEIIITRYLKEDEHVVIPSLIDGYNVTAIGESAFNGKWDLTTIEIPDTVTSIGDRAFVECGLVNVDIPNSVTSIGNKAFLFCGDLKTVKISNSVVSIGKDAFTNNWNLVNMKIPPSVTYIGEDAFYGCHKVNLTVKENSYAHTYAIENNIPFSIDY